MITLLSAFIGFLASAFPKALDVYQDAKDKKHELDILRIQADLQREGHYQRIEEVSIQSDAMQYREMYKTYHTGISWVDALNGLVRPVITFTFFFLYMYVKLAQFSYLSGEPIGIILSILWAEEDQALFASIIGFYFGQRTFNKVTGRV